MENFAEITDFTLSGFYLSNCFNVLSDLSFMDLFSLLIFEVIYVSFILIYNRLLLYITSFKDFPVFSLSFEEKTEKSFDWTGKQDFFILSFVNTLRIKQNFSFFCRWHISLRAFAYTVWNKMRFIRQKIQLKASQQHQKKKNFPACS